VNRRRCGAGAGGISTHLAQPRSPFSALSGTRTALSWHLRRLLVRSYTEYAHPSSVAVPARASGNRPGSPAYDDRSGASSACRGVALDAIPAAGTNLDHLWHIAIPVEVADNYRGWIPLHRAGFRAPFRPEPEPRWLLRPRAEIGLVFRRLLIVLDRSDGLPGSGQCAAEVSGWNAPLPLNAGRDLGPAWIASTTARGVEPRTFAAPGRNSQYPPPPHQQRRLLCSLLQPRRSQEEGSITDRRYKRASPPTEHAEPHKDLPDARYT
jgi:hypothetical protein